LARPLARVLIKNLPEDLLRELKRLKVELDCRIWAELLGKLVESRKKRGKERAILLTEEELKRMKAGVQGFLELRDVISHGWVGAHTVLEELRRSRGHHEG